MLVNVKETLERVIEVESIEEAEKLWNKGKIELTPEDIKDVEFTEYEG